MNSDQPAVLSNGVLLDSAAREPNGEAKTERLDSRTAGLPVRISLFSSGGGSDRSGGRNRRGWCPLGVEAHCWFGIGNQMVVAAIRARSLSLIGAARNEDIRLATEGGRRQPLDYHELKASFATRWNDDRFKPYHHLTLAVIFWRNSSNPRRAVRLVELSRRVGKNLRFLSTEVMAAEEADGLPKAAVGASFSSALNSYGSSERSPRVLPTFLRFAFDAESYRIRSATHRNPRLTECEASDSPLRVCPSDFLLLAIPSEDRG